MWICTCTCIGSKIRHYQRACPYSMYNLLHTAFEALTVCVMTAFQPEWLANCDAWCFAHCSTTHDSDFFASEQCAHLTYAVHIIIYIPPPQKPPSPPPPLPIVPNFMPFYISHSRYPSTSYSCCHQYFTFRCMSCCGGGQIQTIHSVVES